MKSGKVSGPAQHLVQRGVDRRRHLQPQVAPVPAAVHVAEPPVVRLRVLVRPLHLRVIGKRIALFRWNSAFVSRALRKNVRKRCNAVRRADVREGGWSLGRRLVQCTRRWGRVTYPRYVRDGGVALPRVSQRALQYFMDVVSGGGGHVYRTRAAHDECAVDSEVLSRRFGVTLRLIRGYRRHSWGRGRRGGHERRGVDWNSARLARGWDVTGGRGAWVRVPRPKHHHGQIFKK